MSQNTVGFINRGAFLVACSLLMAWGAHVESKLAEYDAIKQQLSVIQYKIDLLLAQHALDAKR